MHTVQVFLSSDLSSYPAATRDMMVMVSACKGLRARPGQLRLWDGTFEGMRRVESITLQGIQVTVSLPIAWLTNAK